jgi:outer membrane cobalamin receptor
MFSYSLTGKRYVQSDNQDSLPAYSLLDFYAGATFKSNKTSFRLQAEIKNLMNKTYQSILYYPEPGISFSINLLISI